MLYSILYINICICRIAKDDLNTVNGKVLGTVNGLAIAAKLVINYDKTYGINL